MKKKLITLSAIAALALSLLAGCSAQSEGPNQPDGANQKPFINFEGIVSAVKDGVVTLEDGTAVQITEDTLFGGGPDSGNAVSEDIQVGSYIAGYTADDAKDGPVTAQRIWANQPQSGGVGSANHCWVQVINIKGVVATVEDDTITLEDGTVVRITEETLFGEDTVFGGDPDSGNAVSEDVQVGNFLQGYTADDAKDGPVTAQRIWTNQPQNGGKLRINFEGRVTRAEDGSVTLDSGKTVLLGEQTIIEKFDGTAAEIAVGDYIQGYAADPDAAELEALRILVTIL